MTEDTLKDAPASPRAGGFTSPYATLIDELYREEVLDARRMSSEEKLLLGEELFQSACFITLEGIRNQNPGFSEEDCQRELDRRLELRERMDQSERLERRR